MVQTFKLTAPIGSSYVVDPDDVSKTKKALMRTGDYEIPSYGLTPYPDTPMFDGLKAFQERNGLTIDGVARPGGETEMHLNQTLIANRRATDRVSRRRQPSGSARRPETGTAKMEAKPAWGTNLGKSPDDTVREIAGMDPDAKRPNLLPLPDVKDGELDWSSWTAPRFVYDMVRAALLPGHIAKGGDWAPKDATGAALTYGLLGTPGTVVSGKAVGSSTLASRHVNLYNGPKVERKFEADYPHGYKADEAGNLIHDIDGRPLQIGGRTVGRRVVGGADEALSATEFDGISTQAMGAPAKINSQSQLGGDVGRAYFRRDTGRPLGIALSNKLEPEQRLRVYGHELGHVVDQLAGKIPVKGIRRDLDKLYNTLNNPNRLHKDPDLPANWGKPWTPAASGYKGDDIPRELIAEAVRLYMANPSYLKDTAPAVAKAIRKAVNGNPELRKIIQFNSGGPPITPANTRPQESTRPKEERRELYRLLDGYLVPYI